MQKGNTDEPLVEASIVGKTMSERMRYKAVWISTAAVMRCGQYDIRGKGGTSCIQALQYNRGEPAAGERKRKVALPSSPLSEGGRHSDQFIVVRKPL